MLIALPLICLIPDFFLKLVIKVFYPNPVEKVLMEQKEYPQFNFEKFLRKED